MKNFKIIVLTLTIWMNVSFVNAENKIKNDALVILSSKEVTSMEEAVNFIEERGGKIFHLFPTHILIGHIPKEIASDLVGKAEILSIHYDFVDPAIVERYGKMAVYAVEIWNRNYILPPKPKIKEIKEVAPLINDTRTIPKSLLQELFPRRISPGKPYGAGTNDISEYMIGRIAVGVILPESIGNDENWTSSEIALVHSEIQAAADWWIKVEPRAGIKFFYDLKGTVSTQYEPIKMDSEREEEKWISDVMNNLNYRGVNHYVQVRNYNDVIQNNNNTDWVFTIFVVDSSEDVDGRFSNGTFAYAYLGGPFMVMTYDNNGWTIDNMDTVCAHEIGHIFYALDEYTGASSPTERAGYLWVINGNHAGGGIINVRSCIMRGEVVNLLSNEVCHFTRGHVGLWDENNNGVLDILDTGILTLSNPIYTPGTTTLTYKGTITVLPPLRNKNRYQKDRVYNDITVSAIANIQYKVNEGNWIDINHIEVVESHPHNGTLTARFKFTTPPLTGRTNTIVVRGINSIAYPLQAYYATNTVLLFPYPFSLIFPTNTTTIATLTVEFKWGTTTAADGSTVTYTLWYGTDSTYGIISTVNIKGLTRNTYSTTTLVDNSTYYWKVQAVDKYGGEVWSRETTWKFYVNLFNEPPGTPTLISPSNGIITFNLTPTFRWGKVFDPDPKDTVTYELWYGKNSPEENKITGITTTYYTLSTPLDSNSVYFWKVWAVDSYGSRSCSATFTLTTAEIIIYPNPFFYPRDNQITFAHLPENSIIKIFTVAGELVTTLTGKREGNMIKAIWKPKDIASGIYLYIIESEGKIVTKGKLGILR